MPPQRAAKVAASLALNKVFSSTKSFASASASGTKAKATTATTAKMANKAKGATANNKAIPAVAAAATTTAATASSSGAVKKRELLLLKRDLETGDDVKSAPKRGKGKVKGGGAGEEAVVVSYSYSSGDITDEALQPRKRRKAATAAGERLVNPNLSSAPVTTVVNNGAASNVAIESTVLPDPNLPGTTVTSKMLREAHLHLIKTNPKLKTVIDRHPECHAFSDLGLSEAVDPFQSLVSGIISQQVSGAAAKSIKAKFVALFDLPEDESGPSSFPTPAQCLSLSLEELRTAGLSQRKAEYIRGLSEKFESGEITAESLLSDPDDVVVDKLVQVRGIGQWSSEMFLCFGLKRFDVFSTGDLGIQKGAAILAGRDVSKLKNGKGKWKYMAEEDMLNLAEPFKPYRSVLMWYLWRLCETNVDAMSK